MYYEMMSNEDKLLCEVAYRAGLRHALLALTEDSYGREAYSVLAVSAVEFQLKCGLSSYQFITSLDFVLPYLDKKPA